MDLPAPPEAKPSLELLARLRAGDRGAFDVLYRRHRDELLLAVRAGMGPALRAALQSEDVLQSVALEAFAVLQRDAPPASGFAGLLRRLVRHRLIDRARAARRRRDGAPLPASTDGAAPAVPAPPAYADPRFERLERALLALPAELREAIRLRRFDGLSSQEVAARTGQSDAAVRKTFSRAMARLTLLLAEPRATDPRASEPR
jgi:RNA polymerase sigma-70 factor, ECF subfamily